MRNLILIVAVVVFSLILTLIILYLPSNNSKGDLLHPKNYDAFKIINFEDYKKNIDDVCSLELLTIIWWQESKSLGLEDHPFKKFCITQDLKTIMNGLDGLSHNKNSQFKIPPQYETDNLRIYFSSRNQKQFRILEIEFTLDLNSHEFISSYGRSAKLYELLFSKEESKNFWSSPWEDRVDSNEYKENMRKMREFVRSQREPNLIQQKP
jgi:hypothetical protein